MSGNSNQPPSSMDVDESSHASGAADAAQAAAGDAVSAAVPASAASGSGGAAAGNSANSAASTKAGSSSNAMDTDAPLSKATVTISTDGASNAAHASSSAVTGRSGKKFHGPFSKYTASHPVTTGGNAGGGQAASSKASALARTDVVPSASFDLDRFLSPYSGITVVDRLIYIADRSSTLAGRAFQQALDTLKTTDNTAIYRVLAERLAGQPGIHLDLAWMDTKNAQAAQQFERLEMELSSYKANLIKDNVRLASRELGDFHFGRGDYGAALRAYSRMRDYCSAPAHHTDMNVMQARACLQLQSFSQLQTHVARAEQQPDIDVGLANQLKCWAALAYLNDRKYKVAARRFLEVRLDKLPSNIDQTIAVQDIAIYATLMALSEFDRNELNNRVLHNAEFAPFLESAPIMLELATSFYTSQYGKCMSILNQIVPDLRLDLRLGDHIETLAKNIRAKALIQYFTPFSSVDMVEMAKAFDVSVAELEKDLAELIVNGSISARIDSHNKRLHATEADQRSATFLKAYNAGDSFRSQSMAMLLRINLIRNNFVVKGGKGHGGAGAEFLDFAGMPGLMNLNMAMRHHKGR